MQSFLAVTPQHPVMKQALQAMLDHYNGVHARNSKEYANMGTKTLQDAYSFVVEEESKRGSKEVADSTFLLLEDSIAPGKSKLYPKVARQGSRPMCDLVLHSPTRDAVYFFSRSLGSPKCGGRFQDTVDYVV